MSRVMVRHPGTGAVREVAASALPVLAQSGWVELEPAETSELRDAHLADRAAAEAAMTPAPAPAPVPAAVVDPAVAVGTRKSTGADRRQQTEKEND
jgi:hypothetical protein